MNELPTILTEALHILHLHELPTSSAAINTAYKQITTPDYFINTDGHVQSTLTLNDINDALAAKKLLTRFINSGTFPFICYNCSYKVNWDISLYIEIEGNLLCHTCQRGVEKLMRS